MSYGQALLGVCGKDFVIIASDKSQSSSLWRLTEEDDKMLELDDNKVLALNGESVHTKRFGEYIKLNLDLKYYQNDRRLTTHEVAQYCR